VIADGFASLTYSSVEAGAQPAISVGGFARNAFCIIQSSDPGGFAIDGAGGLEYSAMILSGVEGFDPALGLLPKTLRDAGLLAYLPSTPSNWAGDPTKAGDALDRIASAVNGLLDGSIPPGTIATGIP